MSFKYDIGLIEAIVEYAPFYHFYVIVVPLEAGLLPSLKFYRSREQ